jgi:hypothetical protein
VRGGKAARSGGGVGMTPGRSPAYGMLASPHPNRGGGMQQNVMASPSRQSGPGGGFGGGGAGGAGMYSGRVSMPQVGGLDRWCGIGAVELDSCAPTLM